jgi:hypothetical protein
LARRCRGQIESVAVERPYVGQHTLDGTDVGARRERYRTLVDERLPEAARRAGDWPIREDHCFARVVLDNVFEDEWYEHVDGRPAYEHLSADELAAAIDLAERLLERGAPFVEALNDRSLRWREDA